MRYYRVLSVLAIVTGLVLGAVALGRSPDAAPHAQLHRALRPEVKQLRAAQPWFVPQLSAIPGRLSQAPSATANGGSCFVAGCSIRPCVVPVASAADLVVPAPSRAATGCPRGDRGQRPLRVSAIQ